MNLLKTTKLFPVIFTDRIYRNLTISCNFFKTGQGFFFADAKSAISGEKIDLKKPEKLSPEIYKATVIDKRKKYIPPSECVVHLKNQSNDHLILIGVFHDNFLSKQYVEEVIKFSLPDAVGLELDKTRFDQFAPSYSFRASILGDIYAFVRKLPVLLFETFQPKEKLRYIRSGLIGFSLVSEMDIAYINGSHLENCGIYLLDKSREEIELPQERLYDVSDSFSKIINDIAVLSFFELFNYKYSSEAFKYNIETIAKFLKNNDNAISLSENNLEREKYLSQRVQNMVKERKQLLKDDGIKSPVWCVAVIGLGHLRGIRNNLIKEFKFEEQENPYK